MFYCTKCAKKNNWPEGFFKSIGKCEVCNQIAPCNEKPASMLPIPKDKK